MYYQYFDLRYPPFSITPDPKFVYFSACHEEALAHLLYGIGQGGGGGFVQLTGEVGTGKTTLCRLLLEQIPDHVRPALILNPVLGPRELLASICDELDIYYPVRSTRKKLVDRLNAFLLDVHSRGETVVLIVDEAQNLSPQALEQIRLLTNLETATDKLLQIILVGQPELRDVLARPGLRQLAQRVTARYHLMPLSASESEQYLRHRLKVAGAMRCPFTAAALNTLHRTSDGVPRLLNVIADRAMLAAYTSEAEKIDADCVREAAREVLGENKRASFKWPLAAAACGLALVVAALVMTLPGMPTWRLWDQPALPVTRTAQAWHSLFQWWEVSVPAGAAPGCLAARGAGLACLQAETDWPALVPLEVPVLLFMENQSRSALALALADINPDNAISLAGGETLSRASIAEHWSGDYVVLARLPRELPARLAAGDQGPGVDWLKAQMRALDPNRTGESGAYDGELAAWIADFQRAAGLESTGIADAATLITLAARSAPEAKP